MTKLYYYVDKGKKVGPFTQAALQKLVERGLVTPGTIIVNDQGQNAIAQDLRWLTFAKVAASKEVTTKETVFFDSWLAKFFRSWLVTTIVVILLVLTGRVVWMGFGVDGISYLNAIFGNNSFMHTVFLLL